MQAQSGPVNPFNFIAPHPPGVSNDILARVLGERLSQSPGYALAAGSRPDVEFTPRVANVAGIPPA